MRILLYVLALISLNAFAEVEATSSTDWEYKVKQDDTVWALCKTYVADSQCWRKLVEYNKIPNPKYIPPGTVIRIPHAWLKSAVAEALVVAVEGQVSVSRDGEDGSRKLKINDKLSQLDTVVAENGSAMIEFADQSRLLLKPNSAVRMQGLGYFRDSGIATTEIRLLKGRVKANVHKLRNAQSRFNISTPAAVAAVRGTEYRVALAEPKDGKAVMLTELLEGQVGVSSDINSEVINAGEAVKAVENEGVKEPVKLLPRPLLALNQEESIALPYSLEWQPLKGAHHYRVSLSRQGVLVWEKQVTSTTLDVDLEKSGDFQIMISGVDQHGFEGLPRRLSLSME